VNRKARNKAENRLNRYIGLKEFASGKNNKGERIYYTCRSTKHMSGYHKKDNKGGAEQKKLGVHTVRTTG
jgi:hypothetical protein